MTARMTPYCRLANRDSRYAEVHEWCRVPAILPRERCGCPCHDTLAVNRRHQPERAAGEHRWVSLGDLIGGPSDAVPAATALDLEAQQPLR